MPLGTVLIGALASGIGQAIKNRQQQQQQDARVKARNQVLADTMALNRPIAEDSRNQFNERLATGAPDAAAEAAAQANRSNVMDIATAFNPDIPVAGSAPEAVRSDIAKAMLSAIDAGRGEAQRLGKVGSYGDLWFNQGVANSRLGNNLGLNANLAGGNLAILPSLQELADVGSIKPMSPIGDILMGVGNAMGSFGGSGERFFNRGAPA